MLAELDKDGSGDITLDEFDFLSRYIREDASWDLPLKEKRFETADTDKDNPIDIRVSKTTHRDSMVQGRANKYPDCKEICNHRPV